MVYITTGTSIIKSLYDIDVHIKKIHYGFDAHKCIVNTIVQAIKLLATYYQNPQQLNEDYKEKIEFLWKIVEQCGGSLVKHPGLVEHRATKIATEYGRTSTHLTVCNRVGKGTDKW